MTGGPSWPIDLEHGSRYELGAVRALERGVARMLRNQSAPNRQTDSSFDQFRGQAIDDIAIHYQIERLSYLYLDQSLNDKLDE